MTSASTDRFPFGLEGGRLVIRDTGARVPIDLDLVRDVLRGSQYVIPMLARGLLLRLFAPGPRIWFAPRRPRAVYLVWNAAFWIGARFVRDPGRAEVGFYFEDATTGAPPTAPGLAMINGACADVSKSRVASVFEAVFGYGLSVDPRVHVGPAVEKGEDNGAHDGRIVTCPCEPAPGKVYQRVIETGDDDEVLDLRTPCVDGRPIVVFLKRRPKRDRFANYNSTVGFAEPDAVFSADERAQIQAFTAAMSLDWGGLDVLRDKSDGRIYIVDVNKTDMPPLKLPFGYKMLASKRLGAALRDLCRRKAGEAAIAAIPPR